jgi:hypothetical protein
MTCTDSLQTCVKTSERRLSATVLAPTLIVPRACPAPCCGAAMCALQPRHQHHGDCVTIEAMRVHAIKPAALVSASDGSTTVTYGPASCETSVRAALRRRTPPPATAMRRVATRRGSIGRAWRARSQTLRARVRCPCACVRACRPPPKAYFTYMYVRSLCEGCMSHERSYPCFACQKCKAHEVC